MTKDFYLKHRNDTWDMPPIPDGLSLEDSARWILNSGFGWLEIDLEFDRVRWEAEALSCSTYLVSHRESESSGWLSCCVHGLSVDKTSTDFNQPLENYHWTEISSLTPTIVNFWKSFPFENLLRVRFMIVEPGGFVAPHNDMPGNIIDPLDIILPINVSITHPEDCHMTLKDKGVVPWAPGKIIMVNIGNDHSVINHSFNRRIHMIGHGIPGNRKIQLAELLVRSYNKQYERNKV